MKIKCRMTAEQLQAVAEDLLYADESKYGKTLQPDTRRFMKQLIDKVVGKVYRREHRNSRFEEVITDIPVKLFVKETA